MPAQVYWFDTYAVLTFTDIVLIQETLFLYSQLVGSARFDDIAFLLADCRQMREAQYQDADFDTHAAFAKAAAFTRRQPLRVAIVVASPESEASIKRLMLSCQKYPSNWNRQIFWDYDKALDWAKNPDEFRLPPSYWAAKFRKASVP